MNDRAYGNTNRRRVDVIYIVRVHNDKGFTDIKTNARSVDVAKERVIKSTGCEARAISMIIPRSSYLEQRRQFSHKQF